MRPKFLSWFRGRDKIDHPLSLHLIHTLCLDLLTSAAPGSGYDMPMNNTHVLCLVPSYLYICPIKAPRGKDKIDPTLSFPHTLYLVLCLDLCNSAAPGGDYITLMKNTHAMCFVL